MPQSWINIVNAASSFLLSTITRRNFFSSLVLGRIPYWPDNNITAWPRMEAWEFLSILLQHLFLTLEPWVSFLPLTNLGQQHSPAWWWWLTDSPADNPGLLSGGQSLALTSFWTRSTFYPSNQRPYTHSLALWLCSFLHWQKYCLPALVEKCVV